MAFYATLALIFILVIRPQEIWPFLEAFHLINVATALATVGIVAD